MEPEAPLNTSGFGSALHFMPLPQTVVAAHCAWQFRTNFVATRIPRKYFVQLALHSLIPHINTCVYKSYVFHKSGLIKLQHCRPSFHLFVYP